MEQELTINNEIYVKKDSIPKPNERNVGLMDSANVVMYFQVLDEYLTQSGEILEIPKPNIMFKFNGYETDLVMQYKGERAKTKNDTKIGIEQITKAKQIIKLIGYYPRIHTKKKQSDNFSIFEAWDKELNCFKKDYPVVFVYGNYAALIAPRVDND